MQGDLRVQAFDGGVAPFDTSIATRWAVVRPLCGREFAGRRRELRVFHAVCVPSTPHTF